jgi:signal transduction histidine kinase
MMQSAFDANSLSYLHPFHIITDEQFVVLGIGMSLPKICPSICVGRPLEPYLSFLRPALRFDMTELCRKQRTLLLLESRMERVTLRGQVVIDQKRGVVLFALTPRILDYKDLEAANLSVHDFAASDSVFDTLLLLRSMKLRQQELENARAKLLVEMDERLRIEGALRDANTALSEKLEVITAQSNQIHVMRDDIDALERMERMKSEFVSTVSHELRTPLASIRGSLGLISGGIVGDISEDTRELVDISLANCERLGRLVDDILDFSRIARGEFTVNAEILSTFDVVQSTIKRNHGYAIEHDVEIALEIDEEIRMSGDRDRVEQVLTNLLSNAIKFSTIGDRVLVRVIRSNGTVRVEVRDNGPGVPIAFRERLFQPFSQADASDTRRHNGTGLGLSISREIMNKMGGQIGFEPLAPTGSCFYFELPSV